MTYNMYKKNTKSNIHEHTIFVNAGKMVLTKLNELQYKELWS